MSRKKKIWKEKKRLHFVFSLGKLDGEAAGKSLTRRPFRLLLFVRVSLSLSLSLSFSQKNTQKVCVGVLCVLGGGGKTHKIT
jgi:hypothetical protein